MTVGVNQKGHDYSLIIATRNRAEKLQRSLERAAAAINVEKMAEIVIVDNGSTDRTPEVIAEFKRARPGLFVRDLREERIGLSRARNAGVAAASADFLVFTDDDCYLNPDYFINLDWARRSYSFDYFSGNVLLHKDSYGYEGGYLKEDEIRYHSPHTIQTPGRVQGSNMGFRREIFARIGGFNELIGAGTPYRFEDVEFATRASLAGFTGIHLPGVSISHDHGRERGSPELKDLFRANSVAAGAYCLTAALLAGGRGIRFCFEHWMRLFRGLDGGRERLRLELLGIPAFLLYMIRKGFIPRLHLR